MCSKQRIYHFAFKRFSARRQRAFWCIQLNLDWFSIIIKMCYLYFFCLHCCLISIHIFDYPDSRLNGLFTDVPTSPDNRGSTVTCFYCASTAVRGARLRSRANCCGNLQLSRFAVSCNYRAVLEMMVKIKCKLTGIEMTLSSYGRCAPYCRFWVSKPNKKRYPIFKKLLCSFISFLSRLCKTCEYISLKLIHSFFGIIHFIEDRQRALNWGLATQRTL